MKKLLLVLALLLAPSLAWGQCNGVFASNTLCGNLGASANVPGPVSSAGIPTGVVNTVTANYSIAPTDCGKTIQAGTGSSGGFTITLPVVSGFALNCTVTVINGDTIRAKILAGFPSGTIPRLYPAQTIEVSIINGAWATTQFAGRWRMGAVTWFVDNIAGSDANDCLAAGAGNACLNILTVINRIYIQTELVGNVQVNIQLAAGQTWNNVAVQSSALVSSPVGTGALLIDGGGGTFTSATSAAALTVASVRSINLEIQNVTITNSSTGDGINCISGSLGVFAGVTFGTVGASQVHISGDCFVNFSQNYSISGGGQTHYFVESGAGEVNVNAITVTLSGTPAYSTAFAQAWVNGSVYINGATYTGAATGPRYLALNNGSITTNLGAGPGPTLFPGNAAGSTVTGGMYDSPGTPSVSGCGGSPGTPTGKDYSGKVVEGTTATGCTVAFTTLNTPQSCTVSSSNATVQAGLVITTLSSTQLVVTHPSASGATLYWNCPVP